MAIANGIDPKSGAAVAADFTSKLYMDSLHDIVLEPIVKVSLFLLRVKEKPLVRARAKVRVRIRVRLRVRVWHHYLSLSGILFHRMVLTFGGSIGSKEVPQEFTYRTLTLPI